MDLAEIRAFLTLCDELHFGHAAERLFLSQSRVSRLIAALERHIGGALFVRNSRNVSLTSLGVQLRDELRPAYDHMVMAIDRASRRARRTSGQLRIGFTITTLGPTVHRLVRAFEARHPDCPVTMREVPWSDPYSTLRDDEIDVLVNWLVVEESDLSTGPVIDRQKRVLAVAADHPLATRSSISVEELAGQPVIQRWPQFPVALFDRIVPPRTPSGMEIPRVMRAMTMHELLAFVMRGMLVHPTVASMGIYASRGVVFVPIRDLPPLPLGLIWRTANEDARISALCAAASGFAPSPTKG